MALILPGGPSWAHYTDNLTLGAAYKDSGVAVTATANNIKGSAVTVLPALEHDVELLRIGIHGFASSGVNSSTLMDIMIDRAGGTNWETTPFIPDLLAGFTAVCYTDYVSNAPGIACWYDFPLWVPAGASLGARAQTAHTSDITSGRIVIQARGGNRNPASWWCGQRVTAIGIDTANSIGDLVATSTTPNFSSWANLGSALPADARAIQAMIQGEGDTATPNSTSYIQLGVNGEQFGPTLVKAWSSYETGTVISTGPLFLELPSGTQFQARGSKTYASATANDVAIYAVH
jgi:hypothetical protein